ncbi:hypothetical protein ACLB2K_048471 [Fragaria x ananassa]
MMNGFPAKSAVIAALLVVLLLMGAFPAASASIPVGGKEYGSVRTLLRREGCFENRCQRMDLFYNKGSQKLDLSLRRLQQSRHQPPPAPSRNGFHICVLVIKYSRCKFMDSAHKVFRGLFEPDLVTWSSLITGYSQSGDYGKALFFFKFLNMEGKKADPILIASVLAAASQIANVGPGSEVHAYVVRRGLVSDVMISSALIAMYSTCGFMGMGIRVFEAMLEKNIVSYNSLNRVLVFMDLWLRRLKCSMRY